MVAAGVSLNLGIPGLALEAVNLGYRVTVVTDAVAGVPEEYALAVLEHTVSLLAAPGTGRRPRRGLEVMEGMRLDGRAAVVTGGAGAIGAAIAATSPRWAPGWWSPTWTCRAPRRWPPG